MELIKILKTNLIQYFEIKNNLLKKYKKEADCKLYHQTYLKINKDQNTKKSENKTYIF